MDIQIKYDNGQMNIHMDAFFPTSQARLKKLLKVIELDYDHRDEHFNTLDAYFTSKIDELEARRVAAGKKYLEYKQKAADECEIINSKKKPNGVKLTKEELEAAKEDLKHFKNVSSGSLSEHNRCKRQKEQFMQHLEIIKQRK